MPIRTSKLSEDRVVDGKNSRPASFNRSGQARRRVLRDHDAWMANLIAGSGSVSGSTAVATYKLVRQLEEAGTWVKLNSAWHMCGDFAASKYFLKYPSGHSGSATYASLTGSNYSETTGIDNAGTGYADMNYVPSAYQSDANKGAMIVYCHTTTPSIVLSAYNSNSQDWNLYPRFTDGSAYYRCYQNGSGQIQVASSDGKGLVIGNRTSSTYAELRINGTIIGTSTSGGGSIPSNSMTAFALDVGGTVFPGNSRLSFIAIAPEGLTADDCANIKSAYETFAAAIGRTLP